MKKVIALYGVKTFPSLGGTDRVAENIILRLKDRYRFILCCYKDPLASVYVSDIEVIQFRPLFKGSLGAFVYFFFSAIRLLRRNDIDLIHAHKTDCAFFIPLLRLRHKVVATSHEAPYKRDKWNWFVKQYFHLAEHMFINSPNACTCISRPLTDYYQTRYKKDVLFIPNGINPTTEEDYIYKGALPFLTSLNSDHPEFILFSARRMMSTKGCHTFLEALQRIFYKGNVVIAGELEHNHTYTKLLKWLSLGLNVHFLGYVSPLPALLALVQHARLFVFPSETEGMSIMLLEVASVGTPIIASDIPENKRVFNDDEVLYFRCGDSQDLADKIRFALDHPEEMKKFGCNSRQRVFSDYLWSNIAVLYSKVYDKLLA